MEKPLPPVRPSAHVPTDVNPGKTVAALQQLFLLQNIAASDSECAGVAKFLRRLAPPLEAPPSKRSM